MPACAMVDWRDCAMLEKAGQLGGIEGHFESIGVACLHQQRLGFCWIEFIGIFLKQSPQAG
jgi:hypothetical protein